MANLHSSHNKTIDFFMRTYGWMPIAQDGDTGCYNAVAGETNCLVPPTLDGATVFSVFQSHDYAPVDWPILSLIPPAYPFLDSHAAGNIITCAGPPV